MKGINMWIRLTMAMTVVVIFIAGLSIGLSGCNAVAGAGKAVQALGEGISKDAEAANRALDEEQTS